MRTDPEKLKAWRARSKPLAKASRKRERETRARGKVLQVLVKGQMCAIRHEGCTHYASDGHERKSRARGGGITDATNIIPVCRLCHDWVTTHSAEAEAAGWLEPSWALPHHARCAVGVTKNARDCDCQ